LLRSDSVSFLAVLPFFDRGLAGGELGEPGTRPAPDVHAGVGLAHPQKPAPMRMFKIDFLAPLKQSRIRRRQLMQPVHNAAYTNREKPPLLRLQQTVDGDVGS
jgi:hypothetical protein